MMAGSNGNGAAVLEVPVAVPAAAPAADLKQLPEAPASVTVRVDLQGWDVMLTLRDRDGRAVLRRLQGALQYLEGKGARPAGGRPTGMPQAGPRGQQRPEPEAEDGPLCPVHRKPMRPSKYGGHHCTVQLAEDGGDGRPVYCRQRIK